MRLRISHILPLALLLVIVTGTHAQQTATVPITTIGELDSTLTGTSSLFLWNSNYWSANDHGTLILYCVDTTTGTTTQTINTGLVVNDLEEIVQNGDYLYLGDVGNNLGARTDLHILRMHKDSLLACRYRADTIFFTYADQTNFSYNNYETDFDCEAFVVSGDSIYLFTKQWTTQGTTCYAVPTEPGRHVAQPRESEPIGGLVTGACLLPRQRILLLCGYSTTLTPFVYICYDFQGNGFFSGQHAKATINTLGLQTEGIASANGYNVYLTNEHFSYSSYINVPPQLSTVDLRQFLAGYLHLGTDRVVPEKDKSNITVYPNPATDYVTVRNLSTLQGVTSGSLLQLCDVQGRIVSTQLLNDSTIAHGISMSLHGLPAGVYQLRVSADKGRSWSISFVKNR
ncbi:MAG: T9SS type A sorting domain-containing protein [Bacteroidales bacterium]|nr:T9SS type A sorting domain-containing protein [Bacteroidales bacterium]